MYSKSTMIQQFQWTANFQRKNELIIVHWSLAAWLNRTASNFLTTHVTFHYIAELWLLHSQYDLRRATVAFEKPIYEKWCVPSPSASALITTYQNDKTEIGAPVSSAVDRQFAPIVAGIKQDVLINLLSCPRGRSSWTISGSRLIGSVIR